MIEAGKEERGVEAEIRYVSPDDREGWLALDAHLPPEEFARKVRDRQGYVLAAGDRILGVLRWGLFWDSIPFCNLLYLEESMRGRGYGSRLMARWEADMRSRGCGMVMTSTQADETAQHFYRKLGYQDLGGLPIGMPGRGAPTELFFVKEPAGEGSGPEEAEK